ncbi:Hypothetical protein BC93_0120 [Mycoplasmopsis bovis]|nr:Hypothetical protein BC85_0120 [Mycoplasmopsis bovis]AMW26097.1 Hypothetical protein BC93_0120 [Mycoplasmopsis bovis]
MIGASISGSFLGSLVSLFLPGSVGGAIGVSVSGSFLDSLVSLFLPGSVGGAIGASISGSFLGSLVSLFLHEAAIKGSELAKSNPPLINISFFLFIFCCSFIWFICIKIFN